MIVASALVFSRKGRFPLRNKGGVFGKMLIDSLPKIERSTLGPLPLSKKRALKYDRTPSRFQRSLRYLQQG